MDTEKVHEGRNVRRFREMMGLKQDALAYELGGDWTQRRVSLMEQKETIDLDVLKEVSTVLKIPVEAFQKLDEDGAVNIISNTFHDQSNGYNYYPSFNINPVDKWMEALEENRKLYERMLKEKDEVILRLEKLLEKGK